MNIQRVKVTISLDVDLCDLPEGVTLEQVAKKLTLDYYSDGRYPFYSEMLHVGLDKSIQSAVEGATIDLMVTRYGNEVVLVPNGSYSRAYHESSQATKAFHAYVSESIKEARIEPTND